MKQIETLVEDIYALFGSGIDFDQEIARYFGDQMAKMVSERVPAPNKDGSLRMSNMGTKCLRKLWYTCNLDASEAIPFTPATRFKFIYGDLLEELVLYLAAEAGHSVTGMQDELEINGVKGHRDAVIDGVVVDVKSASTYSFRNFVNHLTAENDKFGYITQLQQYLWASQDDPLVTDKDRAAFLVVDKTLGHLCLDIHGRDGVDYGKYVDDTKAVVNLPGVPKRGFEDKPEGKSGNRALCTECSYCDWRLKCWPGVRTFIYSNGPKYLTQVVKEPNVPEATN